MLHTETVERKTLELLRKLQGYDILDESLLVGGTSLALQIGHRSSDDLDLFTTSEFDLIELQDILYSAFDFVPQRITGRSIIGFINGIKVDFIYHPFRWIGEGIKDDGIRIASLEDIAAMKVHAIINSGERPKDFVDLAYLSRYFSYDKMKDLLLQKYPNYDPIMADRAVNYFDDIKADLIPEIKMIDEELDFKKIKKRLILMTSHPERVFKTSPLKEKKQSKGIRM
ncbi:MAG: nucleotidyl transferase AbiEii/AbiGii toxin family protein [Firmicutes bacterium]|nr:nucleotidyl transferase AbiEii/AbiGii toxin family protein [Bacillota bacterium]